MQTNTQLTSIHNFNPKNIIFSDPIEGNVPSAEGASTPALKFKRVKILVRNLDGTVGDLIFSTERLYSHAGISENTAIGSNAINGYSFVLSLCSRDGVTENEKKTIDCFDKVLEACKEYIFENQGEIGKEFNSIDELRNLSVYYRKKIEVKTINEKTGKAVVKKEIDPTSTPLMYPKLNVSKKNGDIQITSRFYNAVTGELLNTDTLKKQPCYARAAIKFESIFIGKDVSIQVKLVEADLELLQSISAKRLLPRLTTTSAVSSVTSSNPFDEDEDENANIYATSSKKQGSLPNSDDEVETVEEKKVEKKIATKKVALKKSTK